MHLDHLLKRNPPASPDDIAVAEAEHVVGVRRHEEYWIRVNALKRLNEAIVGPIEVVRSSPPKGAKL